MKKRTREVILSVYDAIEDLEPDISTERLFAMTCEEASRRLGFEIDSADVADVLADQCE